MDNIILITVDSLRSDHLGIYGADAIKTPNINQLATSGTVFEKAFANGCCTSVSVPSFLTSKYVTEISDKSPTIIELLKQNGYKTATFNPNVQIISGHCRALDLTRGFDLYEPMLTSVRKNLEYYIEGALMRLGRWLERPQWIRLSISKLLEIAPLPINLPCPSASTINQAALKWIKAELKNQQPFFLWLFYMDVHEPYFPIETISLLKRAKISCLNRKRRYFEDLLTDVDVQALHNLYSEKIEYLDTAIGELLNELKSLGVYEDTTIIITADHGEEFREHGRLGHPAHLYDENIHIPLIIQKPTMKERRISELVSLLDLGPTLATLAQLDHPQSFAGKNLMSEPERSNQDEFVLSFGNWEGSIYAYRTSDEKIIIDEKERKLELYNLKNDPLEKENLDTSQPELLEQLRNKAQIIKSEPQRKQHKQSSEQLEEEDEEAIKARLRDLGYLE